MPFVHIDVVRGRDRALLIRLIEEVSRTVADTLDTPVERVRVMINEVDPDLWGIGGVPYSVVRAVPDGSGT
ncbi:MAG: 4-oxalocrotonate tautomerase family protein [Actinomycetota bacterium]|nr:4-oxalocrotonate tautomerase family protein [Actinomycetota bacterium]